jgi:hypothetical protein
MLVWEHAGADRGKGRLVPNQLFSLAFGDPNRCFPRKKGLN